MSTSLKPVSIVIPIKNRGNLLPNLIKNLLNLHYTHFEIIIVDDYSTDNTKDILKKYPIKSISLEKSVGSAQARNIGINQAKNDIIALTDSDCIVSRNWLNELVPFLEKYDVVGGKILFLNSAEMKLYPINMKNETVINKESAVNFLNTTNMIFRKDLWKSTNGFLDYRIEDLEFSWRVLKKGFKLIYVPKGLVIHYGNRSIPQNIRRFSQYGKSYSKIAFIHKMNLSYKPEPIFNRHSISSNVELITYPFVFLLTLFICNILVFNVILLFSLISLSLFLFLFLIFRLMKKLDIIYKLYKFSAIYSIAIYSLIYALKK